jgi:lysyl-tRNA synthetase class I
MANWYRSAYRIGLGVALSTIIGSFAQAAKAAEDFNNNFIRFEKDVAVEFEFVESRGAYQSTMGVINGGS